MHDRRRGLLFVSAPLALLGLADLRAAHAAVPTSVEVSCDVDRSAFVRAARDQANVTFRLWTALTGGSQVGGDYVVPMTDLVVVKSAVQSYDSVRRRSFLTLRSKLSGPVNLGTGEVWLDVSVGTTTLTCDYGLHRNPILGFPPPARKKLEAVAFARESNHSETCDECTSTTDISARVYNSANISIPNASTTILTFDSERWDTASIHDTSTNTSRLTAPVAGKYLIFGHVQFDGNVGGSRSVQVALNGGAVVIGIMDVPATAGGTLGSETRVSASTHYDLQAEDFVQLQVVQDSGGSLDVKAAPGAGQYGAEFGMVKLP